MLFRYLLALVIQLFWVALGVANKDATIVYLPQRHQDIQKTNIIQTIPWVTDAPDYFHGYGGKAIGAVCLSSASPMANY